MRVAPEPVMSEVVRQRLEALLAEVRPRHALDGPPEDAVDPELEESPAVPGDQSSAPEEPSRPRFGVGGTAVEAGRRVLEFTREHVAAVLLVLAVGCSWTVYSLLQARSVPVAVAAPPSVVASPVVSSVASPAPRVLVHVVGAVRRPGLVELDEGSRVADAVEAAGGLSRSADAGELNLAAVVADGSQVVIGTRARPGGEVRGAGGASGRAQGGGTAPGAAGGQVSLNTATLEQLDALPGVGPVTAQRILDWRARHGRFGAVAELQEVEGIGPKTYADLAPHVRV